MSRRLLAGATAVSLLTVIAACTPAPAARPTQTPSAVSSAAATPTAAATTSEPTPPTRATADRAVIGTVVRFRSDRTSIDVTIGEDSPAVRDFLSMLPLRIPFEEFNDREKIAYLPRELDYAGSRGSDPENGDLIYFTPWGNLGFYYNTEGIGYSDVTLHLGTYNATEEELSLLEGGDVTIEVIG